jgi:hypothetical protein
MTDGEQKMALQWLCVTPCGRGKPILTSIISESFWYKPQVMYKAYFWRNVDLNKFNFLKLVNGLFLFFETSSLFDNQHFLQKNMSFSLHFVLGL